jgi:hypothetical protein
MLVLAGLSAIEAVFWMRCTCALQCVYMYHRPDGVESVGSRDGERAPGVRECGLPCVTQRVDPARHRTQTHGKYTETKSVCTH